MDPPNSVIGELRSGARQNSVDTNDTNSGDIIIETSQGISWNVGGINQAVELEQL